MSAAAWYVARALRLAKAFDVLDDVTHSEATALALAAVREPDLVAEPESLERYRRARPWNKGGMMKHAVLAVALLLPAVGHAAQANVNWSDDPTFSHETFDWYEIQRKLVPTPSPLTAPVDCHAAGDVYHPLAATNQPGVVTLKIDSRPGVVTYRDTSVVAGSAYCFRVRLHKGGALGGYSASDWSNESGYYVPVIVAPSLSVGP